MRPGVVIRQLAPQFLREIVLLQPAVQGGLRLLKQTNGIRKTRFRAAVSVSRWAAASKEAGTVTVTSWSSNANPASAKRRFQALFRWSRMSAEARTGEIFSSRLMSSDPHGRNRAERSVAW